jgi:RHS repeat-associated protein
VPRIGGIADASISSGALSVIGTTRGGEAVVSGFENDYYMVTADVAITGSNTADLLMHYIDPNNTYKVHMDVSSVPAGITLYKVTGGAETSLASGTYTTGASVAVKIKVYDDTGNQRIKVWVDGTLKINTTDATHPAGRVAFGGVVGIDNLKIGYDNNADDDIEDVGDDLVLSETFASTSVTVSHDHAGNLVDDGTFVYKYDAWNRLVLVRSSVDADVTIQTAEFDGKGRRMKKTISNSGDLAGTTVYFYVGQKICESRDGSGNMVAQFIHGTQYIDELVMMRAADKGDLYVHQDANFNVIGVTDLGGSLIERYVLEPYGELTVHQRSSYGDRDGDGDVDATDKGTPGTTCTGTVSGTCRILDLDFDGDYDSSDATLFDNLDSGNAVHPGRRFSALAQHFGHQGLWFDAQIEGYQNRMRRYDPTKRLFLQRDPLAEGPGVDDALDRLSLYRYERNSPLVQLDPSGGDCVCKRGDDTSCAIWSKRECPNNECTYCGNTHMDCVWRGS